MNSGHSHAHGPKFQPARADGEMSDPVCGMLVTNQSPHHVRHGTDDYYFCSAGCQEKFTADPARYIDAPRAHIVPKPLPTPSAAGTTIYTCPMHPQIRQPGPGNCPICGMALEPLDSHGNRRRLCTARRPEEVLDRNATLRHPCW